MPRRAWPFAPATEATKTLMWEACRRDPDVAVISAACEGEVQPTILASLALSNRIGPLLWRALSLAGCTSVLGDERKRMEDMAELYRFQSLLLHPLAVAQALTPLHAAGLEPLVMKGPSVARYYPEPGLRPMDDLDLYLPDQQHNEALRVLEGAGWTVARARKRDLYDTQLRHRDVPSMPLELHYGLDGWHERSNRLDPMWLWERRVPIDCMGTPAFGLPLEEDVVYLASHAGKPFHNFDRLIWLADLAMVIGDAPVDWDAIEAIASRHQCVTVVTAALQMATRMGLELPAGRFELPAKGWRAVPLQELCAADWPLTSIEGKHHIRFALVDTRWRRLVLFGAGNYNVSWSDRIHMPSRTVARYMETRRKAQRALH
jgi:hypothetical protein